LSELWTWVGGLFGRGRRAEVEPDKARTSDRQQTKSASSPRAPLRYTDVFVAGGFPRHTYNPRLELDLEARVRQVTENICKLVVVTGHTKSGKTVLVRSVLPREEAVWVDGGAVGAEEDFWTSIVDQLNLFQSTSVGEDQVSGDEVTAKVGAGVSLPGFRAEAGAASAHSTSETSSTSQTQALSSRVVALKGLTSAGLALVVDDFHYLPRALQGDIVRALKPLVFDGLPVVIIAIPHRRYDALKVEKEMTGRILPVDIPSWNEGELSYIPATGFALLNGQLSETMTRVLAQESIGSPHLMQEFCRAICRTHGIVDSFGGASADLDDARIHAVFAETAETIGRPIFEKLARGPRQRADRIPRRLKNGTDTDIYGLVLHALAHIRPGLVTLEYEELRAAIRDVSAQDSPQLHEIARVLKHMADIAATDESSTPAEGGLGGVSGSTKALHLRLKKGGSAYRIRTGVTAVRGRRPRPLDECATRGCRRPRDGDPAAERRNRIARCERLSEVSLVLPPSSYRVPYRRVPRRSAHHRPARLPPECLGRSRLRLVRLGRPRRDAARDQGRPID
jgi:hypothetical protein